MGVLAAAEVTGKMTLINATFLRQNRLERF